MANSIVSNTTLYQAVRKKRVKVTKLLDTVFSSSPNPMLSNSWRNDNWDKWVKWAADPWDNGTNKPKGR